MSSVEGLARRLVRGDLLPDTPVHDASTGMWAAASESPVVQFLLEELRDRDETLPPEWDREGPGRSEGERPEGTPLRQGLPEAALEELFDDAPVPPSESVGGGEGPFDIEVTLSVPPESEEPQDPAVPWQRYLAHTDEARPGPDGGLAGADPKGPGDPGGQGSGRDSEWIARPDDPELHRPEPMPEPASADPWSPETSVGRTPARPRSAAGTTASPGRRWRPLGLLGGGVALAALLFLALRSPGADDPQEIEFASGPGAVGGAVAGELPPPPPIPEGMQPEVEAVLSAFAAAIQVTGDSLAAEMGVGGAPPPAWLGGRYLAAASAFPDVATFWQRYGAMVMALHDRDRTVFDRVLAEAVGALAAADREGDAATLQAYLEDRYARAWPRRDERYAQLREAADRALDLHAFLVSREDELRFTPALGGSVPRDPVLEVGTENPQVLAALNAHLDELFRALDRSRGGGALSQGGLRADLFLGFGAL